MFNRFMLRCWAGLALVLLAACGGQPTPASPAPTAAAPPTRAPAPATAAATIALTLSTSSGQGAATAQAPTAAPTAGAAQPGAAVAIPDGLTPEGYHILGRADAPVTLVMYSDFL